MLNISNYFYRNIKQNVLFQMFENYLFVYILFFLNIVLMKLS